uniref:Pleiotropic drug resistance protein 1 n=1 Tax=Rhizophora mucronata TaxID=61149 RepID=A0A2P2IH12_RHIMU
MNVILLTVSRNSSKCFLFLWVPGNSYVPFNVSTSFPTSQNIHQCCFASTTNTH